MLFCAKSASKPAATSPMGVDWSWEGLISEQPHLLDKAWSTLVARPVLTNRVLGEHGSTVLLAGSTACTASNRVNTTSLAKIFFDTLGVTVVNGSFTYYRDAMLFGLMLSWGLEVHLGVRT